jgi:ribosomal protein S27E
MPVKMTKRGLTFLKGSCPTCKHPFPVAFSESQPVKRFSCDWCSQWVTAELKEGKLEVSTKDAQGRIPVRRDETCPHCGAPWELWFDPNGVLAKQHGTIFLASGNKVTCVQCSTEATVSLD